jgi:DNA anti-recombination protein RmuC
MEYLFPTILVIWTIVLIIYSRNLFFEKKTYQKKNVELNQKNHKLKEDTKELQKHTQESLAKIENEKTTYTNYQNAKYKEFERLVLELKDLKDEFSNGFLKGREWLAEAFSEYVQTIDHELETSLIVKPNPAWKANEVVSEIRTSRSEMSKRLKCAVSA